jgi:hypothetical protein
VRLISQKSPLTTGFANVYSTSLSLIIDPRYCSPAVDMFELGSMLPNHRTVKEPHATHPEPPDPLLHDQYGRLVALDSTGFVLLERLLLLDFRTQKRHEPFNGRVGHEVPAAN